MERHWEWDDVQSVLEQFRSTHGDLCDVTSTSSKTCLMSTVRPKHAEYPEVVILVRVWETETGDSPIYYKVTQNASSQPRTSEVYAADLTSLLEKTFLPYASAPAAEESPPDVRYRPRVRNGHLIRSQMVLEMARSLHARILALEARLGDRAW